MSSKSNNVDRNMCIYALLGIFVLGMSSYQSNQSMVMYVEKGQTTNSTSNSGQLKHTVIIKIVSYAIITRKGLKSVL